MRNLEIIENDLVPVYRTSTGEKVVYGTELHRVLNVKSSYRDWIRNRLNDCDAVENEDYETFAKNLAKPNGGRPSIEHLIRLDIAKEMAMLERNEKGKQVRRYFIQVEKKYKESRFVQISDIPLGEVASYVKEMDRRLDKQGTPPWKVCAAFKMVSEQFGIRLPDDFVMVPEYEQMSLPISGEVK